MSKTKAAVTTDFKYDVRNQLSEVKQGVSVLGRYGYDYEGLRVLKLGDDGIRRYTYDQLSVVTETNETSITVSKYDYGLDQLVSLDNTSDARSFFHLDFLGSTTNLTDDLGGPRQSILYDVWGNERDREGTSANKFTFTGHEKDEETGLIYAKARFYDPDIGRFTTQDSFLGVAANAPSLHRYAYVHQNPTRFHDPNGRQAQTLIHKATPEAAARIVTEGFESGTSGFTWFASKAKAVGGPSMEGATAQLNVQFPSIKPEGTISRSQLDSFYDTAKKLMADSPLKGKQLEQAIDSRRWRLITEHMVSEGKFSYKITLGKGKGFFYVTRQAAMTEAKILSITGEGASEAAEVLAKLQASDDAATAAAKAAKSSRMADRAAKAIRIGGRVVIVVAIASDVYRIYSAEDRTKEVVRTTGGWAGASAGAYAGGKGGAALGGAIGGVVGGIGAVPGATVGGATGAFVFGVGGYFFGEYVAEEGYEWVIEEGQPAIIEEGVDDVDGDAAPLEPR